MEDCLSFTALEEVFQHKYVKYFCLVGGLTVARQKTSPAGFGCDTDFFLDKRNIIWLKTNIRFFADQGNPFNQRKNRNGTVMVDENI